jgi:hypothetical protein
VVKVIDAAVQRGEYQAHNLPGRLRRRLNWAIGRNIYGLDRSPHPFGGSTMSDVRRSMRFKVWKAER